MNQKTTIPLLHDHHDHVSLYSTYFNCLDLSNIEDKKTALDKLRSLDKDGISVAFGWNSRYYTFSKQDLRDLFAVIIVNISLHSFIMTKKAENLIKDRHPEVVSEYKNQEWFERHYSNMMIFLANLIPISEKKIKNYFKYLLKRGVSHTEDKLLTSEKSLSLLLKSPFAGSVTFWADIDRFLSLSSESQKKIKGIKIFTDGALGSKTAALSCSFKNGKKGILNFSNKALYKQLSEISTLKKPVAIHAIGDRAISQVLEILGQIKGNGEWFPEVVLEHCQFITQKTAFMAKELGVILSMQPNFNTDTFVYVDRLPKQFLKQNNPFRMLIKKAGFKPGIDLLLGSDGMPHGVEAAIQNSLFPPLSNQRLTLQEFTAGYCMPDFKQGYIEVIINEKNQIVSATVYPNMDLFNFCFE